MGRGTSLLQRQGGNVWRLLRGGDPDAGRDRETAPPGGNLPGSHRQQLSQQLDLPGRSLRAVVQRVVDNVAGTRHSEPIHGHGVERDARQPGTSPDRLSFVQFEYLVRADSYDGQVRSLLSRLAGAPLFRRLLAPVV